MADIDIKEIADARYMGLMCPPASPEAKALVNDIINIIEQAEQRQRARKAKDMAAFRSAVGIIVGDLLIAVEVKEHGWSYHGLSPAAFEDRPVGYKTFKSIVMAMEKAGLIEVSLGRNAKGVQFEGMTTTTFHPSLASRFKPTMVLIAMADEAAIVEEGASKHFLHQLPKRVIEVRGKSSMARGIKTKGTKIRFTHSDKSLAMEAEIKELNSFLVSFDLDGAGFSGYRRLFNNGDVVGFDFQRGGRVYAVGDHSYQGMKQQDRARMKIGGEEVVEIDINASYLTILHGISGFALPERDDIYDISGIDRAIVKAWVTSTIGHHSFHSRWPKNALAEIKAAGVDKPKGMTMASLQPTILDHFPMLSDWPSQKITWADLMFIESEIVIGTMVELMRSYGAPCFSVHDSIIVRKKDQKIAVDTLENQFLGRASVEPKLKVRRS
jgi:hypothetical protein